MLGEKQKYSKNPQVTLLFGGKYWFQDLVKNDVSVY